MEGIKQKLSNVSEKSAKRVNCFLRLLPIIMGVIVMLFSLTISVIRVTISFGGLIIGFYMTIGGIVLFMIKKRNQSLFESMPILEQHFGEGLLHIVLGTLCFTVTGINDVLGVFLFITGFLLIIRGAYIIYMDRKVDLVEAKYSPLESTEVQDEAKYELQKEPSEEIVLPCEFSIENE